MIWVIGFAGAILGAMWFEEEGLVLGLLGGLLYGYCLRLSQRMRKLEQQLSEILSRQAQSAEPAAVSTLEKASPVIRSTPLEPVVNAEAAAAVSAQAVAPPPRAQEEIGQPSELRTSALVEPEMPASAPPPLPARSSTFSKASRWIRRYFTTGNVVAKVGVIVLFFGVSFLLKYAVERNALPVEVRLAAVAGGGLALLMAGWRKRNAQASIGLILQGAGVGVLYLTVFAAARLYQALPDAAAMVLMIMVVALSAALAVLQDSRALAVAGSIGGFLAPILLSRGGGSHVALFSYYALLNAGICGIAWFKSWRVLNWVGFVFTFVIGAVWGITSYRSEHFATTEPFLILFFVFFLVTSVLFAYRQPPRLKGYVDATLVFGLPVTAFALQCALVRDFEYARALSALALGGLYLLLSRGLWNRYGAEMRTLAEAFLALGIVFLTLTIPFALDANLTAAAWALEGAGMVWVGFRQLRVLARSFGFLLQFLAGCAFTYSAGGNADAMPVFNTAYLGGAFIAIAGLFSAYWYEKRHADLRDAERGLHVLLLVWGLGWWFAAGWMEIFRQVLPTNRLNAMVAFSALSFYLFGLLAARLRWNPLAQASLLNMFVTAGFLSFSYLLERQAQPLAKLGWLLWPAAIYVWYDLLWGYGRAWPRTIVRYGHAVGVWIWVFLVSWSLERAVSRFVPGSELAMGMPHGDTWWFVVWGLIPALAIGAILRWGGHCKWPVREFEGVYFGGAPAALVGFLLLWLLRSCFHAGDAYPLPFLPIANPLEITQGIALVAAVLWALRGRRYNIPLIGRWPAWYVPAMLAASIFIVANTMIARATHHLAGVPFTLPDLIRSTLFEAAIAVFWGITALTIMSFASRRGVRTLWFVGGALLVMLIVKLFMIDLAGSGTVGRIVSFLATGGLMMLIGYVSPVPPRAGEARS